MDWSAAEERWGTPFPSDYREFMGTYGAGGFEDYLEVFQPLATADRFDSSIEERTPDKVALESLGSPYPSFPAPGGLICWGIDSSADALYWSTRSPDPDSWTVVVWRRHKSPSWVEFECGFAEFLSKMIHGQWDECPLSGTDLWNRPTIRFINYQDEDASWERGIDPWSPKSHDRQDKFTEESLLQGASNIAQPQLSILGVSADTRSLRTTASIAVAPAEAPALRLATPLGRHGLSVAITNADGVVAIADGLGARVEGQVEQSGSITVSAERPLTFELILPDSALAPGYDWQQVVRSLAVPNGGVSLTVTITDPGVRVFREALGDLSPLSIEGTLSGSWPPIA